MARGYELKVAICGKSGLVGSKLEEFFQSGHNEVVGIKVREETTSEQIAEQIEHCDIVINLSGTTILGRWSDSYKQRLYDSRIDTTRKLVDAMALCSEKPKLFLSASAVGMYDSVHQHNDSSVLYGDDFLSHLCKVWEEEARRANALGIRTVQMRLGVIYAKKGGAMQKMLPAFKMGVGGKLGSGEQLVSWIHIEDLVRAVEFIIKHPDMEGSVNFTAPYPLSNADQTKVMGSLLGRPTFLDIPAFAVRLLFGEGATVMLDSKEVYPTLLLEHGFVFRYPHFEDAFEAIIG